MNEKIIKTFKENTFWAMIFAIMIFFVGTIITYLFDILIIGGTINIMRGLEVGLIIGFITFVAFFLFLNASTLGLIIDLIIKKYKTKVKESE